MRTLLLLSFVAAVMAAAVPSRIKRTTLDELPPPSEAISLVQNLLGGAVGILDSVVATKRRVVAPAIDKLAEKPETVTRVAAEAGATAARLATSALRVGTCLFFCPFSDNRSKCELDNGCDRTPKVSSLFPLGGGSSSSNSFMADVVDAKVSNVDDYGDYVPPSDGSVNSDDYGDYVPPN